MFTIPFNAGFISPARLGRLANPNKGTLVLSRHSLTFLLSSPGWFSDSLSFGVAANREMQ
jgi:hypothetical protein